MIKLDTTAIRIKYHDGSEEITYFKIYDFEIYEGLASNSICLNKITYCINKVEYNPNISLHDIFVSKESFINTYKATKENIKNCKSFGIIKLPPVLI